MIFVSVPGLVLDALDRDPKKRVVIEDEEKGRNETGVPGGPTTNLYGPYQREVCNRNRQGRQTLLKRRVISLLKVPNVFLCIHVYKGIDIHSLFQEMIILKLLFIDNRNKE